MGKIFGIGLACLLLGSMLGGSVGVVNAEDIAADGSANVHVSGHSAGDDEKPIEAEIDIEVDALGTVDAIWGALWGKYGWEKFWGKVDLSVTLGANIPLHENQAVLLGVRYYLTKSIEAIGCLLEKAYKGLHFVADYKSQFPTDWGSMGSWISLEYSPSENKFYLKGSVTVNIPERIIKEELVSVDLREMKVESEFLRKAGWCLEELGKITFGDPANPDKPDTFEGETTGFLESSEPIRFSMAHVKGRAFSEVNVTDPTVLNGNVSATITYEHIPCDYGDAPDPPYPSLNASNGARHRDWSYEWLGPSVNGESDSKQVDADEFDDGVTFLDGSMMVDIRNSGEPGRYDIGNASKVMYLNAWIDYDHNGVWDDCGEKVIGTCGGYGTQMFAGPAQPVYDVDLPPNTWMRIRLDYAENVGLNPQPWTDPSLLQDEGQALYGEVEDYVRRAPVPVFPNWYAMAAATVAVGALGYLILRRRLLKRA